MGDQAAVIQELYRRKAQLPPDQQPIVEELNRRLNSQYTSGDFPKAPPEPTIAEQAGREFLNTSKTLLNDAPTAGGAYVGAQLGAPAGPPGMAIGAILGGAGMEAVNILGRTAAGKPPVAPGSTLISPETPTGRIAEQGLFGGLQELGALLKPKTLPMNLTTSQAKLGAEFNVPMTKGQRGQLATPFVNQKEAYLRNTLGGFPAFRKLDERQAKQLSIAAQGLFDEVTPVARDATGTAALLDNGIHTYQKAAGDSYQQALAQASNSGLKDVPLDPNNIATPAQKLLDELFPGGQASDYVSKVIGKGGKDAESLKAAQGILQEFAAPTKAVPNPAAGGPGLLGPTGAPLPTQPATVQVPKSLKWEEARRLRTILFDLSNSGDSTIGKGALGQMNKALDDEMTRAAGASGNQPAMDAFHAASSNYKTTQQTLENTLIARIQNSDRPAAVIRAAIGSPNVSEPLVDAALKVAPQYRDELARGLLQEAWHRGTVNNVNVGQTFSKFWEQLPDDTKTALFKGRPDLVDKITRFNDLVNTLGLSKDTAKSVSSVAGRNRMMGGTSTLLQLAGGAGIGGAIGARFNPMAALEGVGLGLAGAGGVILTPAALAWMATRPGAVDILQMAAKTSARSPEAGRIASRLARLITTIPPEVIQRDRLEPSHPGFPQVVSPAGGSPTPTTAGGASSPYLQLQQALQGQGTR